MGDKSARQNKQTNRANQKTTHARLVTKPLLAFPVETVCCFPVIFSLLDHASSFVVGEVEI